VVAPVVINQPMSESNSKRIPREPRERARDIAIGVVAGVAVLGFVLVAISSLFHEVGGKGQAGTIIAKELAPRSEVQFTVALPKKQPVDPKDHVPQALGTEVTLPGGPMERREIAGTYVFRVKLDDERVFKVWVNEQTYNHYKVGDRYYLVINPDIPAYIDTQTTPPAPAGEQKK
jgi:hypothetical protein